MKKEQIYEFKGTGLTTIEKHWAEKKFEDYKLRYHISTLSDLELLEELCFRQAIQERMKQRVETVVKLRNKKQTTENKEIEQNDGVSKLHFRDLNGNLEQILILKEKLGLFEDKKADDPFKYIQRLKEKFKVWRDENSESRTFPCPHCKQAIMLKIRMKEWEAMKHPFFKGRYLANEHLWKIWREGKVSKEDIAKILDVSPDYVDFIEDKLYQRPTDSSRL